MKEMQFTAEVQAPKEKVWAVLWQDSTLRQWAGLIDPGTYMKGELIEGGEVEFISAENGYGVTSLVEKVQPNELVVFRHEADTQEAGSKSREKQWTGGKETYELTKTNDMSTLTVTFDVPPELEQYFQDAYPKVMAKIKELAEAKPA